MTKFQPTYEQQDAISCAFSGQSFKICAYAGTGKTSTLNLIGDTLSNKKGLYLAFNKAIATEAQSKFKSNIRCKTFHSLAYGAVPSYLTDKLFNPRTMPKEIASKFHLRPTTLALEKNPNKEAPCSVWDLGLIIERSINNFCISGDTEVSIDNVMSAMPKWADPDSCISLAMDLLSPARAYWDMCIDQNNHFKINHGVYLKYWSLNKPFINTDFVLFDEAQDADPIMLNLLSNQGCQLIYVGDRHQQIYNWRGAVNAMETLELPEVRLTKSFRFGEEIANTANVILKNLLGEKIPLVGNENINSTCSIVDEPDAFLVRTNASAFEIALILAQEGRRPRVEVDVDALNKQLDDADKMQLGVKVDKNSDYFGFNNWDEVVSYVEVNQTCDIAPFSKLIQANGVGPLRKAIQNLSQAEGDCLVSTAHKSKGLEFGNVMLYDDFIWNAEEKDKPLMTIDESRLTYVAATRAMNNLDYGGLRGFFKQLYKLDEKNRATPLTR